MHKRLLAGVGAVLLSAAAVPADAFPRAQPGDPARGLPHTATPEGYGYWHGHHYRNAIRRHHHDPGAEFQLRQSRRIFCRNTPERC